MFMRSRIGSRKRNQRDEKMAIGITLMLVNCAARFAFQFLLFDPSGACDCYTPHHRNPGARGPGVRPSLGRGIGPLTLEARAHRG